MNQSTKPRAHIVAVWTKRLGGGYPMIVCYIAGYSDPIEAQEAVNRHIGEAEGDDVKEPSPINDATAQALGVKPGERHPKRPRDPAQLAKLIADIATAEVEDRKPKAKATVRNPLNRIALNREGELAGDSPRSNDVIWVRCLRSICAPLSNRF